MNKKTIYLIVGIVFVIVALFVFNNFLSKEVVEQQEIEENTSVEVISINNLIVPDQAAEDEIFIEKVLLKSSEKGGFVVIRRESVSTTEGTTTIDKVGEIIGVSKYIAPGITDNLIIGLDEGEAVEIGENLVAALYSDGGDMLWDEETDIPIVNREGLPVVTLFTIMTQGDIDIGPKL